MTASLTRAWRIEEFEGIEGLRHLESDWRRLVAAMPEQAWHHAYETHLAHVEHLKSSPGRFIAFALQDETGVQAICPLEERRRSLFGWRASVWELPCDGNTLVRDVICPPGEARDRLLPALLDHFRSTGVRPRWIALGRILKGSAAWDCMSRLPFRHGCLDEDGASDVLDARLTPQEHSKRHSRKFRASRRNARNRLSKLSDVRFVRVSDPEGLAREFEVFLEVEGSGWKGPDGTGMAVQRLEGTRRYYEALVTSMPGVEINALYAEGRCLASLLCARAGSEYAAIKIGYDEEYRKVGPGQLLLERTLARCCDDPRIRRVNMVSHTPWVQAWKPEVVPVVNAYLHAAPRLGSWYLALLRARFRYGPTVKKWLGAVRKSA